MALGVFLDDQALFDLGTRLLFEVQYSNNDITTVHGHAVNLLGLSIAATGEVMEFNRGGGDSAHGTGTLNSLVNAAEILRQQDVGDEHNLYEMMLSEDGDTRPRLLLGSEFAANAYVNSPTNIIKNDSFSNGTKGSYSEMVLNYYLHVSSDAYAVDLTREANAAFRPTTGAGYIAPWTTLTHADVSE